MLPLVVAAMPKILGLFRAAKTVAAPAAKVAKAVKPVVTAAFADDQKDPIFRAAKAAIGDEEEE